MMFSVPQFIDVEDKIAGPLTWKQLGWMMAMGVSILIIRAFFPTGLTIAVSIPIVFIFATLAFYRPGGMPMIYFLSSAVMFIFRPKVVVWERPQLHVVKKQPTRQNGETFQIIDKRLTREELAELARTIDHG